MGLSEKRPSARFLWRLLFVTTLRVISGNKSHNPRYTAKNRFQRIDYSEFKNFDSIVRTRKLLADTKPRNNYTNLATIGNLETLMPS